MPIEIGGINSTIPLVVGATARPADRRRRRDGAGVSGTADGDLRRLRRLAARPWSSPTNMAIDCCSTAPTTSRWNGFRAGRDPHGRLRLYRGIFDVRRRGEAHRRSQHDDARHAHRPLPAPGEDQPREPVRRPAAACCRRRSTIIRRIIFAGKIVDVARETRNGFSLGSARIDGLGRLAWRRWRSRSRTKI